MSAPTLNTYGGALRDIGYAGQVVDGNPVTIMSKTNELAGAIDFGIAVARGASDDTCKVISADGHLPIGMSVRHAIRPAVAGVVNYVQYDSVPVMYIGFMYVVAYETVVRGEVAISVTAQGGKLSGPTAGAAGAGRVSCDGTGGKARIVWETSTTAGNVGIVRVNS